MGELGYRPTGAIDGDGNLLFVVADPEAEKGRGTPLTYSEAYDAEVRGVLREEGFEGRLDAAGDLLEVACQVDPKLVFGGGAAFASGTGFTTQEALEHTNELRGREARGVLREEGFEGRLDADSEWKWHAVDPKLGLGGRDVFASFTDFTTQEALEYTNELRGREARRNQQVTAQPQGEELPAQFDADQWRDLDAWASGENLKRPSGAWHYENSEGEKVSISEMLVDRELSRPENLASLYALNIVPLRGTSDYHDRSTGRDITASEAREVLVADFLVAKAGGQSAERPDSDSYSSKRTAAMDAIRSGAKELRSEGVEKGGYDWDEDAGVWVKTRDKDIATGTYLPHYFQFVEEGTGHSPSSASPSMYWVEEGTGHSPSSTSPWMDWSAINEAAEAIPTTPYSIPESGAIDGRTRLIIANLASNFARDNPGLTVDELRGKVTDTLRRAGWNIEGGNLPAESFPVSQEQLTNLLYQGPGIPRSEGDEALFAAERRVAEYSMAGADIARGEIPAINTRIDTIEAGGGYRWDEDAGVWVRTRDKRAITAEAEDLLTGLMDDGGDQASLARDLLLEQTRERDIQRLLEAGSYIPVAGAAVTVGAMVRSGSVTPGGVLDLATNFIPGGRAVGAGVRGVTSAAKFGKALTNPVTSTATAIAVRAGRVADGSQAILNKLATMPPGSTLTVAEGLLHKTITDNTKQIGLLRQFSPKISVADRKNIYENIKDLQAATASARRTLLKLENDPVSLNLRITAEQARRNLDAATTFGKSASAKGVQIAADVADSTASGAVLGGLLSGTFSTAQGGDFGTGFKKGAIYGAAGGAGGALTRRAVTDGLLQLPPIKPRFGTWSGSGIVRHGADAAGGFAADTAMRQGLEPDAELGDKGTLFDLAFNLGPAALAGSGAVAKNIINPEIPRSRVNPEVLGPGQGGTTKIAAQTIFPFGSPRGKAEIEADAASLLKETQAVIPGLTSWSQLLEGTGFSYADVIKDDLPSVLRIRNELQQQYLQQLNLPAAGSQVPDSGVSIAKLWKAPGNVDPSAPGSGEGRVVGAEFETLYRPGTGMPEMEPVHPIEGGGSYYLPVGESGFSYRQRWQWLAADTKAKVKAVFGKFDQDIVRIPEGTQIPDQYQGMPQVKYPDANGSISTVIFKPSKVGQLKQGTFHATPTPSFSTEGAWYVRPTGTGSTIESSMFAQPGIAASRYIKGSAFGGAEDLYPWQVGEKGGILHFTRNTGEMRSRRIDTEPVRIDTEPVRIDTEPVRIDTEPVRIDTEPVRIDTEPVRIDTEPVRIDTEPVRIDTEPVRIDTEPVRIDTEPVRIDTEPVRIDTEPVRIDTEPVRIDTEPVRIDTEPVRIDTEPVRIDTEPVRIDTEPVRIDTEPVRIDTEPVRIDTEPVRIDTEPVRIDTEPVRIDTEPVRIDTEPVRIDTEPVRIDTEPVRIDTEPVRIDTEPVRIDTEPVRIDTEPVRIDTEPVRIDTEPVRIDTEPVRIDTEPVRIDTEPVRIDTEPVRIDTERIDTEPVRIDTEPVRIDTERLDTERLDTERIDTERIDTERIDTERLDTERLDTERLDTERIDTERIDTERIDTERIDPERIDPERIDPERIDPERIDPERIDPELIKRSRRIDPERIDPERIDPERIDPELIKRSRRLDPERRDPERIDPERLERKKRLVPKRLGPEDAEKEIPSRRDEMPVVSEWVSRSVQRLDHRTGMVKSQPIDHRNIQTFKVLEWDPVNPAQKPAPEHQQARNLEIDIWPKTVNVRPTTVSESVNQSEVLHDYQDTDTPARRILIPVGDPSAYPMVSEWVSDVHHRAHHVTGEVISTPLNNAGMESFRVMEWGKTPPTADTQVARNLSIERDDGGVRVSKIQTMENQGKGLPTRGLGDVILPNSRTMLVPTSRDRPLEAAMSRERRGRLERPRHSAGLARSPRYRVNI